MGGAYCQKVMVAIFVPLLSAGKVKRKCMVGLKIKKNL